MPYRLFFTVKAEADLAWIEKHDERKLKKVRKALANLQQDPGYPSLRTKKLKNMSGPHGLDLNQSYVENRTPGA
jgi:Txe/YoeB family toxin of Txe-Axe toxin-antitoxin module